MFCRYNSAEGQLKQDVHLGVLEGLLQLLLLVLQSLAALAHSCLLLLHPTARPHTHFTTKHYAAQRYNQACIAVGHTKC